MTLYLVYGFETTDHTHTNMAAFWSWMADRNLWFYSGLDMVLDTSWRVETQPGRLLIHHEVAFVGESGLADYRAALAVRGRDRAWEERRCEQDRWYRIVSRSLHTSPPVPMVLPRCGQAPGRGGDAWGTFQRVVSESERLSSLRNGSAFMDGSENTIESDA
ncbi:hypothetical protein AB0P17_42575 [Streptomyces sp. NPDC088124]|uniref:hypothetical protein n=1 Tax=Streptomyces sp. NPDC088124 TaxID=3154654 RepID=UPI00343BD94A